MTDTYYIFYLPSYHVLDNINKASISVERMLTKSFDPFAIYIKSGWQGSIFSRHVMKNLSDNDLTYLGIIGITNINGGDLTFLIEENTYKIIDQMYLHHEIIDYLNQHI